MSDFKMRLALIYLQKKMNGADIVDYIDQISAKEESSFVSSPEKDYVNIATVLIEKRKYKDCSDYLEHINSYIKRAVLDNAELITLPQLVGMLPLKMIPGYLSSAKEAEHFTQSEEKIEFIVGVMETLGRWLMEVYVNTYCSFAQKYNITIHAGSILVMEKNKLYNRSYIFSPSGDILLAQDKLYLSQEEKDWGLTQGDQINVAFTQIGSVAVFNDRDSLYYENFKIAREMGAKLVLFSHSENNKDIVKIFKEALNWRCDEQGIFVAQSGYFYEDNPQRVSVICPTAMTKAHNGILFNYTDKGVHITTLAYPKLKKSFDTYSTDKNTAFYKKALPDIYNKKIKI